jgi:hypothetical protein
MLLGGNMNRQIFKKDISKNILFSLIFLFIIIPFIQSAPPVTTIQQFSEGFVIEGSPQEYLKQNQDYQYNFFLYNISNGINIGGTTASCIFYLADDMGSVLYSSVVPFKSEGYFGVNISGGNFSKLGHYNYGIYCNSTIMGGAFVSFFKVTSDGQEYPEGVVIVFFIIIFLILVGTICYLSLYSIGHLMSFDFDIRDLAIDWGVYFIIVALYYLQSYYLGNLGIENYLSWFLIIGGILLILIPIIAFIMSIFGGSFDKRKVATQQPPKMFRRFKV